MYRFVVLSVLLSGCSCQTGIGITGREDASGDAALDAVWDPLIENLGDPGWRESTEPWCDEPMAEWITEWGFDVWSDSRGVFVLLSEENWGEAIPVFAVNEIYFNDGTGWSSVLDMEGTPEGWVDIKVSDIIGIPNGPLWALCGSDHYLMLVEDGSLVPYVDVWAHDIHVVSETSVYAALGTSPRLATFDGTEWSPFPGEPVPFDVKQVWANDEVVFLAGDNGTIISLEDGHWIVHDTGTLSSFNEIWGLSGDDIWASTYGGELIHFDGTEWTDAEWPNMGDDSDYCHRSDQNILGMWGTADKLFMHTAKQFFVWDGSTFSVLAYWPGEESGEYPEINCEGQVIINSIWGNSDTEVFLAVYDESYFGRSCTRPEFLLWWDGSEFHWF
jgi:hypothetical protein